LIILIFGGIVTAVKNVFHYVTSAVERAIGSSESYDQATSAGLSTDQDSWIETYDLYSEAREGWQRIVDLPEFYKVSEEFSVSSPFDWRQQHIMKMKIHGKDLNTGELVEQWITVENDTALSKTEWLQKGNEAVIDSPFGYSYEIDFVSEYEYYQKGL
jgi:hypothetical protein